MRYLVFTLLCLVAQFGGAPNTLYAAAGGTLPPLTTLAPGAPGHIAQNLPVNVVLIGFIRAPGPGHRHRTLPVAPASLCGGSKLAASQKADQFASGISAADADATAAVAGYQAMEYRSRMTSARAAYTRLLGIVDALHIPFDSTSWQGDFRTPSDVRSDWRAFLRSINLDRLEPERDFLKSKGIELTTPRLK